MNTNSGFPKCLFESVIAMFVVSFYFICRDCCLKLPVVAKKGKPGTIHPISLKCEYVCVVFIVFYFFLFFFWLGSWLPGSHDYVPLLPSCFWVSLDTCLLDMYTCSAGCWSYIGVCVYSFLSYQHAIWTSSIAQKHTVMALG